MERLIKGFLDTAALTHTYQNLPPAEEFLSSEWSKVNRYREGKLVVFTLNGSKNSKKPRLTLSQTADHLWHLTAEVSFPEWLRGSNFPLCNEKEIPVVLSMLSKYVSEKSGLDFDAHKARIIRVDFAEDIYVGEENIKPTIKRISEMPFDKFKRHLIDFETVYFENKGKLKNYTITYYDKYTQIKNTKSDLTDLDKAKGILRLEVRIRTSKLKTLTNNLKLPNRLAETLLNRDVAGFVCEQGKEKTYFRNCLVREDDLLHSIEKIGRTTNVISIIGFIGMIRRFGIDFYKIPSFSISKKTYQRHMKKCLDQGINLFE